MSCRGGYTPNRPANYHPSVCVPSTTLFFSHRIPSDLGHKLFSKGNVQHTHRGFEREHKCNVFCKFFEVPTSFVQNNHLKTTSARSQNNVCLPFYAYFVYSLTLTPGRESHLRTADSSLPGRLSPISINMRVKSHTFTNYNIP